MMGNICDRTRSKYGKKRIYLLWGSLAAFLTFVFMWVDVPVSVDAAGNYETGSLVFSFIYYLLMYMLFSTGFTIVMVPYNALLPDMVEDYTLRSKYTAIRMVFSAISAIAAGLLPPLMKDAVNKMTGTDNLGFLVTGIVFGLVFAICVLWTFLGTWEKPSEPIKVSMKETFAQSFSVFRNRSFRQYLGIFLFGQGSSDFVTTLAIYFIVVVLYPGAKNVYNKEYMYIMGAILISQLLAMVIFNFVLGKTSKKFPLYIGFPVRILATGLLLLSVYFSLNIWLVVALSFVAGLGTAASSVSSYAILSDTADIDELVTSIRRPGVCSGMATFTRKVAAGLAAMICGLILTWSGYDNTINGIAADEIYSLQFTSQTKTVIGYCYVFIPIIMMVACLIFTYLYKVNKKEMALVQKEISRRQGKDLTLATEEEKKTLEKITGFTYDRLWNKENAGLLNKDKKTDEQGK
jgi:oligogalacturonide transporter